MARGFLQGQVDPIGVRIVDRILGVVSHPVVDDFLGINSSRTSSPVVPGHLVLQVHPIDDIPVGRASCGLVDSELCAVVK